MRWFIAGLATTGLLWGSIATAAVDGSFISVGSLETAHQDHTAALLPDGRVPVVGGFSPESLPISEEIRDPATGAFSLAGTLSIPRARHTASPLPDGSVLVMGGASLDCSNPLASAEIWTTAAATVARTDAPASTDTPAPTPDPWLFTDIKRVLMGMTSPLESGYWGASSTMSEGPWSLWPHENEPIETMVEMLDVPLERMASFSFTAEDRDGDTMILVSGISVPGVATRSIRDALVTWAHGDWKMRYDQDPPAPTATTVAGKDVLHASLGDFAGYDHDQDGSGAYQLRLGPDSAAYFYAADDTAIRILGRTDEIAIEFIERLS